MLSYNGIYCGRFEEAKCRPELGTVILMAPTRHVHRIIAINTRAKTSLTGLKPIYPSRMCGRVFILSKKAD
jgi:hypothetical protein